MNTDEIKNKIAQFVEDLCIGDKNKREGRKNIEDALNLLIKILLTSEAPKREEAVREERKRILNKLWNLREWHSNPNNQRFGIVSANTTLNAIDQCRERVQEGQTIATLLSPANTYCNGEPCICGDNPTKTDKQ